MVLHCTISDNTAYGGGGIYCEDVSLTVSHSIICGNLGDDIYVSSGEDPTVEYSDICEGGGFYSGNGNISADPQFVSGPPGGYYLPQVGCGQSVDSPCVDAGSGLAENSCFDTVGGSLCMDELTTCTQLHADVGDVDLGYHYPIVGRDIELPPASSMMEEVPDIGDDLRTRWMD